MWRLLIMISYIHAPVQLQKFEGYISREACLYDAAYIKSFASSDPLVTRVVLECYNIFGAGFKL